MNKGIIRKARIGGNLRYEKGKTLTTEYTTDIHKSVANFRGLLGELAFSVLLNLRTATAIDVVDKYDFVLPDGRTVDVKYTRYRKGTLVIDSAVEKDSSRLADLYVLVVGKEPELDIVGYIDGETLWNNFSYHPRLHKVKRWLPQERLIPIEELVKEVASSKQ